MGDTFKGAVGGAFIGGLLGPVGSQIGAYIGGEQGGGKWNEVFDPLDLTGQQATDKALSAQERAAREANATQKYMYDQTREDLAPYRQAGYKALAGIEENKFMDNWQEDPGYQFRLGEGMKAINSAAAARGMGNSGATMKALTRYGQDFATNEYNNIYNREYNRLSGLAGIGNAANTNQVNANANYGNNVSGNQIGLGNSIASANIAQSNRIAGLVGQGAQAGALAYASDERLKTDITPISKEDLSEMKKHLKAYSFKYISDEFGNGDWIGVMAQDLEKSKLGRTLVVEDENGNKMIDMKKAMSLFLATLAEG